MFQDEDLAIIAAQQYYIEYGPSPEMVVERLQSLLPSYIPDSSLQGPNSLNYWMQGVCNAFKKSDFVRDRVPPLKVKEEVVNYAKYKWPLLFSRFYEAYKFAGELMEIFILMQSSVEVQQSPLFYDPFFEQFSLIVQSPNLEPSVLKPCVHARDERPLLLCNYFCLVLGVVAKQGVHCLSLVLTTGIDRAFGFQSSLMPNSRKGYEF